MHAIRDIGKALEQGDKATLAKHFYNFKGAAYIEESRQIEGLQQLINTSVKRAKCSRADFSYGYGKVDIHRSGDFAWAIAETTINERCPPSIEVSNRTGYTTFVLRKIKERWRVMHTHSSVNQKLSVKN